MNSKSIEFDIYLIKQFDIYLIKEFDIYLIMIWYDGLFENSNRQKCPWGYNIYTYTWQEQCST